MAREEIRVSGFGGQGVILTAHIIGKAATLYAGRHATMTQAFGPEARGSACSAQVLLDDKAILYPYLRDTGILITLSQEAYNKFIPELAKDGLLLYEKDLVRIGELPPDVRAYSIPATRLAEEKVGRTLFTNIVMIGFLAAVGGFLDPGALKRAVESSVPRGTEKMNQSAFETGYEYGLDILKREGASTGGPPGKAHEEEA
ncbi:MAG: 2-oxoacid:acceptor oxidoreductase family protein [Planctomycetota bacterium]|jgi:2-oxoglutarate ferredoxin oxidoreductase subunit gamma